MASYFIKVEGEIIVSSQKQYAQNWACGGVGQPIVETDTYFYDENTHSVKSNLILNDTRRAVPYAVYYTEKGIRTESTGDIVAYPGYGAALEYYKENISKIHQVLKLEVAKDLSQSLYRGLFTDVFSVLELFLSDLILCLIYSNDNFYKKAVTYHQLELEKSKKTNRCLEARTHEFFFKGVVYHQFDKVKTMYKQIIGVDLPDSKKLKTYKRNNIVHRFSLSNIDRMCVTIIKKNDILNLIKATDEFVNQLIEKLK